MLISYLSFYFVMSCDCQLIIKENDDDDDVDDDDDDVITLLQLL